MAGDDGAVSGLVGFLAANRRRILVDALAIAVWVVLLLGVVTRLGWPRWVYYPLAFAGAVAYTFAVGSWRRPGEGE